MLGPFICIVSNILLIEKVFPLFLRAQSLALIIYSVHNAYLESSEACSMMCGFLSPNIYKYYKIKTALKFLRNWTHQAKRCKWFQLFSQLFSMKRVLTNFETFRLGCRVSANARTLENLAKRRSRYTSQRRRQWVLMYVPRPNFHFPLTVYDEVSRVKDNDRRKCFQNLVFYHFTKVLS